MIIEICQYVAGTLMVLGSLFGLLAAIGVLRFPDLYTRLHAATKAGLVGAGFVLLAAAFSCFDTALVFRALAGIGFLVLTSPISAHLLAHAALSDGERPPNITNVNDLDKEGPLGP